MSDAQKVKKNQAQVDQRACEQGAARGHDPRRDRARLPLAISCMDFMMDSKLGTGWPGKNMSFMAR